MVKDAQEVKGKEVRNRFLRTAHQLPRPQMSEDPEYKLMETSSMDVEFYNGQVLYWMMFTRPV